MNKEHVGNPLKLNYIQIWDTPTTSISNVMRDTMNGRWSKREEDEDKNKELK